MDATQHCRTCGQSLETQVAGGRCLKCLATLAFTLEDEADAATSSAPSTSNPERLSRLRCFGDYELIEEIARGGMGVVFKARQLSLGRFVAVKMLLSGQFAQKDFVGRFHAEARAAATLQHPHIVAVHEVGEQDGQQYFSMDYVAGGHLGDLVREQPLPARRAAALLKTIAEAVHFAHERGVLHRDLKPSNILLDAEGQPRVTDFGLAKRLTPASDLASRASDLTVTGQMLGTPSYMSPEQAGGRRGAVTASSDIYSLGAMLYFLLTGRPPVQAETVEAVLDQLLRDEPVSPRRLNPSVPRDLETICLKCLGKEPLRRYATAQALAEDLGCFLRDEPIHARPARAPEKLWRWCRRKPALAISIAALLVAVGAGLSGILWQWNRAEQHAARETSQRVRAEEALTLLELQRAEDLLEKDEVVLGLAYLTRMVRRQPTNRIAAQRLLSALTQRNFALPVGPPLTHGTRLRYAEFSPDGRRVATASIDLTARVWDTRTGEPLTAPLLHTFAVRVAGFSPDGASLVTIGDGSEAQLWEVATGRRLGRPMSHSAKIETVEFSPDGRRLLTASHDGTARIWDSHSGEPVFEPLRHQGPVLSAHFSADGTRIVTASQDKTSQVWDARTGQRQGQPFLHSIRVSRAEFSPDGRRVLTTADDSSVSIWDVSSGETVAKPLRHPQKVNAATFSPDGQRILTASAGGVAQIWNAHDSTPVGRPMRHRASIWTAEFSPEGQRLLTGSVDNTARLWDADSGEPLFSPLEHDDLVFSARFSADGIFVVTASGNRTARVWDVRPGAMRSPLLSGPARWIGASYSPDGETIATMGEASGARLWNAGTGQAGTGLAESSGILLLRWSLDGQRLAGFCADRSARIWDAQTGTAMIEPIPHGTNLTLLKFSPDGQWLATASRDWNLYQWNARTGEPRGEPIRNRSKIEFFDYSPDGQRLICSDFKNDQARLHDAASGRLLVQTSERDGRIMHGDFSADGQRLITASEDGTARIWRTDTLQPLTEPLRHKGSILWARFSHDGRRVVTASEDGTARVWDARTGQPAGEPLVHRAAVKAAEFSPDDLLIATASADSTARLWDATTGRPVAEPFTHGGEVTGVRFSPDGRRLLTIASVDGPRTWDVPPVPGSAASLSASLRYDDATLLADLADAVVGKRVDPQGALENVSAASLGEVRQRVNALPRDADFTRWLEWFLADRRTRTISPNSRITIPEYITRRMEEKTLPAGREAVLLAPTNAPALAHLGEMLLISPGSNAPVAVAEAGFLLRRAETLAPNDAGVRDMRRRLARPNPSASP